MDSVRHWTLTVCVCCVLVGALRLLLPMKGSSRGIKTVLALYILLAACTPVTDTDWSGFWNQVQHPPQLDAESVLDINDLMQQQFCENLEKSLLECLHQNGIQATVQVCACTRGDQLDVDRIQVQIYDSSKLAQTQSAVMKHLGSEVPVEYTIAKEGTP